MEIKTNAMRLLDKHRVAYRSHCYAHTSAVSGTEVAEILGQDPRRVFKTLVTIGKSRVPYVFLVPVAEGLDLKKAAQSVGEKTVEMIKSKELFPTTGYIHGGCSPLGMKKLFATTLHQTAQDFDTIIFSAGKIGYQVELSPGDLAKIMPVTFADLI